MKETINGKNIKYDIDNVRNKIVDFKKEIIPEILKDIKGIEFNNDDSLTFYNSTATYEFTGKSSEEFIKVSIDYIFDQDKCKYSYLNMPLKLTLEKEN